MEATVQVVVLVVLVAVMPAVAVAGVVVLPDVVNGYILIH